MGDAMELAGGAPGENVEAPRPPTHTPRPYTSSAGRSRAVPFYNEPEI